MTAELHQRLFTELDALRLIDPHTHINPHAPAAESLADLLGYHYYTELVHSAGVPRETIEDPSLGPKEKVGLLVEHLGPLRNTVQYSWLVELCQEFFDLPTGEEITTDNWEALYDTATQKMAQADWQQQVLEKSKLDSVFLTNDFDDPLNGFDTQRYVPCLRTDDLVFKLCDPSVRMRLQQASNCDVKDVATLREAIGELFEHFTQKGCRACAISLPPDFAPQDMGGCTPEVDDAVERLLAGNGAECQATCSTVSNLVFWTLAEFCSEYRLPFDLMIGVNRQVYAGGVYQGQDLFDARASLYQYRHLLNAFPRVTFPISVLASGMNQELVSYAWIFPNVVPNGHWWYSNTPTYIEQDAAARLEAVPQNKQIGYYSDMYKLEFALPKFRMYKRVLAKILAERFVVARGWSEEQALELGRKVLRGNVEQIFACR